MKKKLLVKEQDSRRATAEMLRQTVTLPVVPLTPSEMDVLQAIARAKERSRRLAFLSYPKATDAEFLDKVLDVLAGKDRALSYKNAVELTSQIEQPTRTGVKWVSAGGLRGVCMARTRDGWLSHIFQPYPSGRRPGKSKRTRRHSRPKRKRRWTNKDGPVLPKVWVPGVHSGTW